MCIDNDIQSIKDYLCETKIHIVNFNDVDFFLSNINEYRKVALVFANTRLKRYFLDQVQESVINCNSSLNRFEEDMCKYYNNNTIFNNINLCNDLDILNILIHTTNIIIL